MTRAQDMAWWQQTIAYEVYPKSFLDTRGQGTGTLAGITQKLDYLAALGVGALWITPCYKSPMVDNGYDVQDYLQIDPSFGTMADMDELIARGRERGIRMVMDLVFNHTSNECAWFVESRSSRANPKADWYIWRDAKPDGSAPTNWRSIFGGSAWEWCEERGQYYLHTFAKQQPDLNWENPQVRGALYDIANFWVDKGVGGFRIDAITYIKKPPVFEDGPADGEDGLYPVHAATANRPGILEFLHEFKREVRDGHDIFMVGEANGVAADELDQWVGANGVFDMLFEFSHTHVPMGAEEIWCRPVTWTLTDLKQALAQSQEATAHNGWYPAFFENHDQPRSTVNFFPCDGPLTSKAKVLAAVLLTTRGTPFVYQGQELGYGNATWKSIDEFDDVQTHAQYEFALGEGLDEKAALAACVRFSRDNARTPMQWDDSAYAGFSGAKPWLPVHDDYASCNVAAQETDADSVLAWYRALAALRASRPELVAGDWSELLAADERVLAFERALGDARAVTLANFSNEEATYDASLVDGLAPLAASQGAPIAGILRPLEAVVWG
ncbi:MAG: alpha-glucosidase [Coriobacteriales bacterium]|nr:alpha-glucosidase [Coriobacteriales bacterium]